MNLYRKYRPKDFNEMIGNEAEIESFKKILEKKDKPHVFLLSGPSGCGKTTLARIAAKKLGADELSITELNSADNRGIDTAREIIQQMKYLPVSAGVRVFIIDELHQTSKDWQNAMLKPLEDTPDHIYFFLCTTDSQKLISALKNRCTQIKVVKQDDELIYRFLKRIAIKEEIEVSKEIIEHISVNCNGSPRLALVLLEKISQLDDEEEMKKIVSIGDEEGEDVLQLCRLLLRSQGWSNIQKILKSIKDNNVDIEKVRYVVLGYMTTVLLNSDDRRAAVIIECFSEPFYNNRFAGLVLACYQSIISK